jgi:hypothetical protein
MDSRPQQRTTIERADRPGRWRALGAARAMALALLLAAVSGAAGLAIAESLGWPFLAGPLERMLSRTLERRVQIGAVVDPGAPVREEGQADGPADRFRVRLVGGVLLQAPRIEIAAPSWSTAPYLLRASDVQLELRYADLWRRWRSGPEQPLRIQRMQAAQLEQCLALQRLGFAADLIGHQVGVRCGVIHQQLGAAGE